MQSRRERGRFHVRSRAHRDLDELKPISSFLLLTTQVSRISLVSRAAHKTSEPFHSGTKPAISVAFRYTTVYNDRQHSQVAFAKYYYAIYRGGLLLIARPHLSILLSLLYLLQRRMNAESWISNFIL